MTRLAGATTAVSTFSTRARYERLAAAAQVRFVEGSDTEGEKAKLQSRVSSHPYIREATADSILIQVEVSYSCSKVDRAEHICKKDITALIPGKEKK